MDELHYDETAKLLDTIKTCQDAKLPSDEMVEWALDRLQRGTEIWLNGTAETQFVYNESYGGTVSCGFVWNGDGCANRSQNCVAFDDLGSNFGNGKFLKCRCVCVFPIIPPYVVSVHNLISDITYMF